MSLTAIMFCIFSLQRESLTSNVHRGERKIGVGVSRNLVVYNDKQKKYEPELSMF